jgi:vancomycin permeability regulator SanA
MKLIKKLLKLIIICFVIAALINVGARILGKFLIKDSVSDCSQAQCAIVLGSAVYSDGTPGEFLKERLDAGIELYWSGKVDKLLFSGDNGQVDYNEVEAMKTYALEAGVAEEDVFLDHAGFSTYESMYRAQKIFDVDSAIVVTQEYHLYRALMIGKILGIDVTGYSANDIEVSGYTARRVREFLATDKDFVQSIFRLKPTYLGDEIPITGDGHLSWS